MAPLARGGHLNDHALLAALAARHRVSVAQIVLRWHVQIGTIPLPKASAVHRMRQNANVFDFRLSAAEMDAISALNRDQRTDPTPMTSTDAGSMRVVLAPDSFKAQ